MWLLPRKKGRIAVVEMFGTIGSRVRSSDYERILSQVQRSRKFAGMVLDIDSPGGSVTASEYIYGLVRKISEKKPVVAVIRGVGASGGYFIGCAAERIVAGQGALVGSIGVISATPILEELLGRLGVAMSVRKSGAHKDMGAFWRRPTDEESGKIQTMIDESYGRFVSVVANARGLTDERVRGLATGEVYWGPKALELGLVDELGDLERGIELAAELAGVPPRPKQLRLPRTFRERLFGPFAESMVDAAASEVERRLLVSSLRY